MKRDLIEIQFGGVVKQYPVCRDFGIPHYLVDSVKEIHGWLFYDYQKSGLRECSQERLLINPANGCSLNCAMCYTKALPGYFQVFWNDGLIAIFKDYDQLVQKQLSKLYVAATGYISPTTEPFQPLLIEYGITERIVKAFADVDLPIEFITKAGSKVPDAVYQMMAAQSHQHSFCQYTIMTPHEDVLRRITPYGDTLDQQVHAIRCAVQHGIQHIVARIDPVFPTITDKEEDIRYIVESAKDAGATHIVMSCVDFSTKVDFSSFLEQLTDVQQFKQIYVNDQQISGDLNADIHYRRKLFKMGREVATQNGLTFALCMEFEKVKKDGQIWYRGLNDEFMTAEACEGISIPLYFRQNLKDQFVPLSTTTHCNGNCLHFAKSGLTAPCKGECGDAMFQGARGLRLKDYRRLSKKFLNQSLAHFL